MITPSATMTEPTTAAMKPAVADGLYDVGVQKLVPPTADSGGGFPSKSFARAMSDSLGGQPQPPRSSVSPSGPASKDGKKGGTQDPNAQVVAGATPTEVLPLVAAQPLPAPPLSPAVAPSKAPMQTTAAASASAGKTFSNPLVAVPAANADRTAVAGAASTAAGIAATRARVDTEQIDFAKNPANGATSTKASAEPLESAAPIEPHVASAADSSRNVLVPALQTTTEEQTAAIGGTAGARQVSTMKSQGKVEEIARTGEKNLPQGNSLPDNGKIGGIGAVPQTNASAPNVAAQAPVASTSVVSALATSASSEKIAPSTVGSGAGTLSAPQVTRVIADVGEAAVSFKRVGINSADVSLRPDNSTELNLHLSLSNGRVEVAARLEQGNFESLNTRWSDLQQSLAQQGIRVGQLDHASLNQNPGSNQHNNQTTFSQTTSEGSGDGQSRRPQAQTTDGVEESPVASTVATPRQSGRSGGLSPERRGWEMWA